MALEDSPLSGSAHIEYDNKRIHCAHSKALRCLMKRRLWGKKKEEGYKKMRDTLILLCMCPHTAMYVSSHCYVCVLILVCMCPHTAMYVSSYCYTCVLIVLYTLYICVLTVLYTCPQTCGNRRTISFSAAVECCIRQHTSAYVSIRQHTSAYLRKAPHYLL
jgi:hypothetical protein